MKFESINPMDRNRRNIFILICLLKFILLLTFRLIGVITWELIIVISPLLICGYVLLVHIVTVKFPPFIFMSTFISWGVLMLFNIRNGVDSIWYMFLSPITMFILNNVSLLVLEVKIKGLETVWVYCSERKIRILINKGLVEHIDWFFVSKYSRLSKRFLIEFKENLDEEQLMKNKYSRRNLSFIDIVKNMEHMENPKDFKKALTKNEFNIVKNLFEIK